MMREWMDDLRSWARAYLHLPLSLTDAAAPHGIVSCKERASNTSMVAAMLAFRYRLCTVYLGIIQVVDTMRSSLVPCEELFFGSVWRTWYSEEGLE
jgi:hypothetical protein